MESEGTLKSCHIISIKNDYMVNTKVKIITLPPVHGDTESSSRTTLPEGGGDDTAQPTVVALSCTSSCATTCAKSPWTSKVNSFLSVCDFGTILDGALPYANAMCHQVRTTQGLQQVWTASVHGLKADVLEAWKRRRKKTITRRPESPANPRRILRRTGVSARATPESPAT